MVLVFLYLFQTIIFKMPFKILISIYSLQKISEQPVY